MTIDAARRAALEGRWADAHRLFAEAGEAVGVADLPLVAQVAYAAGHLDVTIETWERAHVENVRSGDRLGAAGAAVRLAMHMLFDTALLAPVRGWLRRAEGLLDAGETPVHAWLAVVRTYERMLAGDSGSAREWAARAVEIGGRVDPAAAAIGRVAQARGQILDGDVAAGLAQLDEAGVATVSGELDPLSTGVVYCELVCALQGVSQFDLAEQWTTAMERWCAANPIGSLHGRCRVHRAEILRLRGSLVDAEREVLRACDELRPFVHRELGWPLVELGRIRLATGDLDGAEQALLAAHDVGWDPQPGLALVELARGDVGQAAATIRDAIERPSYTPSKELPPNTDLRRAPLFAAQVEIEIAAGDLDRARAAVAELARIASKFSSKPILAGSVFAQGRLRLAEGAFVEAERQLVEAARLWHDIGAPYEAARARAALADAHRSQGHEHRAESESRAASAIFERIGARTMIVEPAKPSATAVTEAVDECVFRRDGDVWTLVFEGRRVLLGDLKGLRYLARLLAEPGRTLHVLDLVAAEAGQAVESSDAGPILDARAKESYRRRLEEIEDDLENARTLGDSRRVEQAETERELLARELARAVGLGGRDRIAAAASERARASVTRALRQALARIREHHVPLASHLDRTIRTGTYCSYEPDPRASIDWRT